MTRMHGVRLNRRRQRMHQPRLRVGRRASRASPQVDDVLSGVSLSMQPTRHDACRLRAFASRLSLHTALRGRTGLLRVRAQVRVRSHVHMACPERAMPMAWTTLAGWQAAPCAAPLGHRIPVPSGRGKMQGKIKGRGTPSRSNPVCTWGWRGTRSFAAPCRGSHRSRILIGNTACLARRDAMGLEGKRR